MGGQIEVDAVDRDRRARRSPGLAAHRDLGRRTFREAGEVGGLGEDGRQRSAA